MVAWVVAGLGLLIGLAAVAWIRRLSRRLDALTQSYWELRYEYTRLRSQLAPPEPEVPAEPAPSVSFVPLSTIRKKDR